mmetsp:Transcript_35625/g.101511  ORF Transcript_35625/g.101511 Transcript_35625/m.101511 type:complete len:310 (+) Transcript_35625:58-987(+)
MALAASLADRQVFVDGRSVPMAHWYSGLDMGGEGLPPLPPPSALDRLARLAPAPLSSGWGEGAYGTPLPSPSADSWCTTEPTPSAYRPGEILMRSAAPTPPRSPVGDCGLPPKGAPGLPRLLGRPVARQQQLQEATQGATKVASASSLLVGLHRSSGGTADARRPDSGAQHPVPAVPPPPGLHMLPRKAASAPPTPGGGPPAGTVQRPPLEAAFTAPPSLVATPASTALGGVSGGFAGKDLPSIGSAAHAQRRCKPCAFMHKEGCQTGFECKFCHLCPPGEKKQRKKERKELRRVVQGRALPGVSSTAN